MYDGVTQVGTAVLVYKPGTPQAELLTWDGVWCGLEPLARFWRGVAGRRNPLRGRPVRSGTGAAL